MSPYFFKLVLFLSQTCWIFLSLFTFLYPTSEYLSILFWFILQFDIWEFLSLCNPIISLFLGAREIQGGTRRIGSGRILRDSWDFGDKPEPGDGDFGFRAGQQQQQQQQRDEKYERRSFGRDFEITRDGGKEGGRRNGRFDRRRISDNREQEEPEWWARGIVLDGGGGIARFFESRFWFFDIWSRG